MIYDLVVVVDVVVVVFVSIVGIVAIPALRFCLRFTSLTSRTILLSLKLRSVAAFFHSLALYSLCIVYLLCILSFAKRTHHFLLWRSATPSPIRADFCAKLSQMKNCMVRMAYACLSLVSLLV